MSNSVLVQNLLFPDDDGAMVELMENTPVKNYVRELEYNRMTWTDADIFAIREGLLHHYLADGINPSRSLSQRMESYEWLLSVEQGPFTFLTCTKVCGYDSVEILDKYKFSFAKWNLYLSFKTAMGLLSPFPRDIQSALDWIASDDVSPTSFLTLCKDACIQPYVARSDTNYVESKLFAAFKTAVDVPIPEDDSVDF